MLSSGIYVLINQESGKVYIGSTNNFTARWRVHISGLHNGVHHNQYLQRSWNKHGEEAFEFIVCEYVNDEKQLHIREQYWLDFHRMFTDVYNYGPCARSPLLGTTHETSKETRRKLSVANRDMVFSKEHRLKLSKSAKQRPSSSEETKRKISDGLKVYWAIRRARASYVLDCT